MPKHVIDNVAYGDGEKNAEYVVYHDIYVDTWISVKVIYERMEKHTKIWMHDKMIVSSKYIDNKTKMYIFTLFAHH